MTNEDAVKIIKAGGWGYPENMVTEANLMAVEALEGERDQKQKPIQDRDTKYRCPVCNNWIRHWQKYCDECGQAIDWKGDGEVVAKTDRSKEAE